jgi:hypothetical protein
MINNETISGTYILEQLDSTNLKEELTLDFDSNINKVSGFAGCNRFFGTYSTNGNTISFSELGATRMMCHDDINKIEQKMFQTIAMINSYELSSGKLHLKKGKDILITANESTKSKSRQDVTSISMSYRASTRGFFEMIWIDGNVFKHTNDRNLKEISRHLLSDAQVSELLEIYKDLDLEQIPSVEPPSKTFQYDAAPMARLVVNDNDISYASNGFDHGNPPKPFIKIVNKVLSIKDTMVKQ